MKLSELKQLIDDLSDEEVTEPLTVIVNEVVRCRASYHSPADKFAFLVIQSLKDQRLFKDCNRLSDPIEDVSLFHILYGFGVKDDTDVWFNHGKALYDFDIRLLMSNPIQLRVAPIWQTKVWTEEIF